MILDDSIQNHRDLGQFLIGTDVHDGGLPDGKPGSTFLIAL
jgi:hypothetical protein